MITISPSDITGLLHYLGITPDKLVPLLIIGWFGYFLFSKRFEKFGREIQRIINAIVEIQTILTNNLKCSLKQTITQYAQTESPVVLKKELRPFIIETNMDKQINEKLPDLLNWLKDQKPETGIDAQEKIIDLVISDKIEKYLDLKEYKQYLYKKGKTPADVYGILAVYLFETLIPKIFK